MTRLKTPIHQNSIRLEGRSLTPIAAPRFEASFPFFLLCFSPFFFSSFFVFSFLFLFFFPLFFLFFFLFSFLFLLFYLFLFLCLFIFLFLFPKMPPTDLMPLLNGFGIFGRVGIFHGPATCQNSSILHI